MDVGQAVVGRRHLDAWAGAAALVVTATVAVGVDPFHTRTGPDCPLLAVTGWACPLCGATRAASALLHGDLTTAVRLNLGVVVVVGLLLALRADRLDRRRVALGVGAALLAFGLVRNVLGGWWLPPAFAG